jgi:phosphoribosylformylglycinamidine synthase subunit PurS
MAAFRFVVSVMPRSGILDPQGRAVESALPHLDAQSVSDVRVGRRVELTVEATGESEARSVVARLAHDLLANPLVEDWSVELVGTLAEAGR